ncbi:MAG: GntR family transcriptional regulator [Rhizobiaceae bacterium]|nr:GntR family transcriptional regulator [Rhizobiaceae bacterium]
MAAESHRFSRPGWLSDILRQRILDGKYQPGERILEAELRSEFGFSNGPIREALQTIVAEGLAERQPYRGIWVRSLTDAQIVEMFQVRTALLEYAAELAARRCTPEMVESGKELLARIDDWFDRLGESGHPEFHGSLSRWLVDATGNAALRGIWDTTMLSTLVYVNASLTRSPSQKARKMVRQVIEYVCKGDTARARSATRALTQQILAGLRIKGTI